MTGQDFPPGARSLLLSLASRHTLRRDAVNATYRALMKTLSGHHKRRRPEMYEQIKDWAIFVLVAVAGAGFTFSSAVYLLLL